MRPQNPAGEAERRTLVRLGVRYGQGYLLGAPSTDGALVSREAVEG